MRSILFFSIFILLAASGNSQSFEQLGGPSGNALCEGIYADGNLVLTSLAGKLWRSNDQGNSFVEINDDFGTSVVTPRCFVKVEDVIIMGAINGDRIYRSTDDGLTWTPIFEGLPEISGFPSAVPIDAVVNNGVIFMCGTNFIRRSSDLGLTWETMEIDGLCLGLSSVGDKVYASPGGNPHVSIDLGETWTALDAPIYADLLTAETVDYEEFNGNMYVTTTFSAGAGFFMSDDNGETFSIPVELNLGKQVQEINEVIYITHNSGLTKSSDNGVTWELCASFGTGAYGGDFMFDGDDTIYCASSTGLYAYSISNESTNQLSFPVANVAEITYASGNMFAIVQSSLFGSFDDGNTWTNMDDQLPDTDWKYVYGDGVDLYLFGSFQEEYYMYSNDGGMTFIEIELDPDFPWIQDLMSLNPVVMATFEGLYVSQDNGMTFELADLKDEMNQDVADDVSFTSVTSSGNRIYATSNQGIAYSYDLGENWTYVLSNATAQVYGWDGRIVANQMPGFPSFEIRSSVDGGVTWEALTQGIPDAWFPPEFIWMHEDRIFLQASIQGFTNPGGIYSLGETETEWVEEVDLGVVPSTIISATSDDDGNMIIGTEDAAVWFAGESGTISIEDFRQNELSIYPNPTQGALSFKTQEEPVDVFIFSTKGTMIHHETLNHSKMNIDVSFLKPGTYVIKLNTINQSSSIKLIKY